MPSGEVGDGNADAHRALARQAGDGHQPAHALGDLIERRRAGRPGSVLAEAADRGIDDARVHPCARSSKETFSRGVLRTFARMFSTITSAVRATGALGMRRGLPQVLRFRLMARLLRCRFWKSEPTCRRAGWFPPPPPGPAARCGSRWHPSPPDMPHAGRARPRQGQIQHRDAGQRQARGFAFAHGLLAAASTGLCMLIVPGAGCGAEIRRAG